MAQYNTFEWALTQNLAYRIRCHLDRFAKLEEDRAATSIQIKGCLPLGDDTFVTQQAAFCVFSVNSRWPENMATITCLEPWVTRKPPEWHVSHEGNLCFEYDLHWKQKMLQIIDADTHGLAADFAAVWLINSTRSLLKRHLFAHRHGIKVWPKEWDFWAHGTEAEKQLVKSQHLVLPSNVPIPETAQVHS